MSYVDGFVAAVPAANKQAYIEMSEKAGEVFLKNGALHYVENWGDDVPQGKTTDFYMAVKAEEGEVVVFSWVVWPSKEARNAGNAAAMKDPYFSSMSGNEIFDGKRMIYSGFETIIERKA
jgi:uncharacterized protein YbaA (DUF1428 family)